MVKKPSAEVLKAAKEVLNKAIKNGRLDGGCNGAMGVSCCLYGYGHATELMNSQICHAEVCRRGTGTTFILDHIQELKGFAVGPSKADKKIFLQYVMDHPVFRDGFWEHDAEKALDEGIMIRRTDLLPSNVGMFLFIFTRAMWETYQIKIPTNFREFLEAGLSPDRAMLAAHLFKLSGEGKIAYNPLIQSGHNAIPGAAIGKDYVRNYLKHFVASASVRTIADGGVTRGKTKNGKAAYVDNVFVVTDDYYGALLSAGGPIPRLTSVKDLDSWFDSVMKEKAA